MNVTLKQIAAFRMVAAHRSFTSAARAMDVTQPVLSAQIRELEAALAARLFDRTTRSVELTEAGTAFLNATADLLPRIDRAVEAVADVVKRRRGRLAIAAPPLLAASLLPSAMATFRRAHPGIDLTLSDVPTEAIMARLLSGEADIAVATIPDDERFVRTILMRDQLVLFSSAGFAVDPRGVTWQALEQLPVIMLTAGSGIRALTDGAAAAAGLHLVPAFEVMQVMTAIAMVGAGVGVAVLPSYAASANLLGPTAALRVTPIVDPVIRREVSIAHRRGRSLSAAAVGFIEILRAQA